MLNGQAVFPINVHLVAQRRFDAIPGSPWVYWVSESLRALFETLPGLEKVAPPKHGRYTGDNFRFLRFWWEVGRTLVASNCHDTNAARDSGRRWMPYMKGGEHRKWYGNQEHVTNWLNDGQEQKEFPGSGERNPEYYFRAGVTWTDLGASGFSARISPGGFISDVSGSCAFPGSSDSIPGLLAVLNANTTGYLLGLVNPTMHYQVGDLSRLPTPDLQNADLASNASACIHLGLLRSTQDETTYDLIAPLLWDTGQTDQVASEARLAVLEAQINAEVYRLYGLSGADRAAIEAELAGGVTLDHEGGEGASFAGVDEEAKREEREEGAAEGTMTREELAVRWISYAVGVVLGRFQPGIRGALGSAIYRRDDFAVGSLPVPDEAEFDELVGPPERFAYVDAEGGRHLLAPEVEAALRALALPDGIAVLDEGHPRDLPALAERALGLMLDEGRTTKDQSSIENLQSAIGMDLRAFLSKDFFTRWHLRWYRKRPVYWPLQSAKRSYGFVLFHERVDRLTLYTLQREYLDYKINLVRQQTADLRQVATMQSGAARRATEREAARLAALLDELAEFARTMERIVRGGYEPEANWIDDGVILRLAPLWELLPLWRAEPKKYWERLARGDFDWSHIAMKYWPARVREKCMTNKSFAIAHGLA